MVTQKDEECEDDQPEDLEDFPQVLPSLQLDKRTR
jgi:hypothetical protein